MLSGLVSDTFSTLWGRGEEKLPKESGAGPCEKGNSDFETRLHELQDRNMELEQRNRRLEIENVKLEKRHQEMEVHVSLLMTMKNPDSDLLQANRELEKRSRDLTRHNSEMLRCIKERGILKSELERRCIELESYITNLESKAYNLSSSKEKYESTFNCVNGNQVSVHLGKDNEKPSLLYV